MSFEATDDTLYQDSHVFEVAKGVRLLRFALVYGANASGKSNIISAFSFLFSFWFSKKSDLDAETGAVPFLLDHDTPRQPSEIELCFYVGETRYCYRVSLTTKKVLSEELLYYISEVPISLVSRKLNGDFSDISINTDVLDVSKKILEEISIRCLSNMSFFAARNQVNCSLPAIDVVIDWMKNGLMTAINPHTNMLRYANNQMSSDKNLVSYMLDFVNKADFNISGLSTNRETHDVPSFFQDIVLKNSDLNEETKAKLIEHAKQYDTTIFEHTIVNKSGQKETYSLLENMQSNGTLRLLGLESAIYNAKINNMFLPIDEIDVSLHPDLVELVICDFLKEKNNRSQLLVTSHYDPLLATIDDLIRRDTVWFVEKKQDGSSDLYSLVDFKELEKIKSFQQSYRNGAFGAVPNI